MVEIVVDSAIKELLKVIKLNFINYIRYGQIQFNTYCFFIKKITLSKIEAINFYFNSGKSLNRDCQNQLFFLQAEDAVYDFKGLPTLNYSKLVNILA